MLSCIISSWCNGEIVSGGNPPAASLYRPNDLLVYHHDIAADLDDLHAMAAGKTMADFYGITPQLTIGTYGWDNGRQATYLQNINGVTRQFAANQTATRAYGSGNYLDTMGTDSGFDAAATTRSVEWKSVLTCGGHIWIAEGGPSDFTAQVLLKLRDDLDCPISLIQSNVHVVQHSEVNESNTDDANFQFVSNNTDYIKVDDGNTGGNTADLREAGVSVNDPAFYAWAVNQPSAEGDAWEWALDFYDDGVDFSDSVEVLHILGIGLNQVADHTDFCNFFN